MRRRELIEGALLGGMLAGSRIQALGQPARRLENKEAPFTCQGEMVVEQAYSGKPHTGKVLAAIQPHADDVPLFAGGTVAKLIQEGYTGYLIRTTNDEMTGAGTRGEGVLHNEQDNEAVARALGLKKTYDLSYRNHRLDASSLQDLRGRLIFLFRLLQVDTVICYDHWGLYEEYPDHFEAGLKPHGVKEKYYFARGPQIANRIVDISAVIDQKVEAIRANITQGPGGRNGAQLRARLQARGLRLVDLGSDDETANRNYIKRFVLDYDSLYQRGVPSDREIGAAYGLEWAERFHYVGPVESRLQQYISKHAIAL